MFEINVVQKLQHVLTLQSPLLSRSASQEKHSWLE